MVRGRYYVINISGNPLLLHIKVTLMSISLQQCMWTKYEVMFFSCDKMCLSDTIVAIESGAHRESTW